MPRFRLSFTPSSKFPAETDGPSIKEHASSRGLGSSASLIYERNQAHHSPPRLPAQGGTSVSRVLVSLCTDSLFHNGPRVDL